MVARESAADIAAIASGEAAVHHGLELLAEDIETNPRNYTRFAVIAAVDTPEPEHVDKASFTFAIKSHPGALADCLSVLKRRGIDMTKLESRPIPGKPWTYMFYVDVKLPDDRALFDATMDELRTVTEEFRNLGVYKSG